MREKGGNRLVPGPDYMVDAKASQPSSQRFWRVATEVCDLVLSRWNTISILLANHWLQTAQLLTIEI
ncbi:hypothetical protein TNCV_2497511 [Trichonephila clavipes]|nr:hypothetical protein TNCV_2497511 [Trichonephila clavipes]